jgi:multiple sugar transport system permease protein
MAPISISAQLAMRRSRSLNKNLKRLGVTSLTLAILALFLSPFLQMIYTGLSTTEKMTTLGAPSWPAQPATF